MATADEKIRVFLSHKSVDKPLLGSLARALLERGFQLFIDNPFDMDFTANECEQFGIRGIRQGDHWEERIFQELDDCNVVLGCISSSALVPKDIFIDEISQAKKAKKLVCCAIDDVRLVDLPKRGHFDLSKIQANRIHVDRLYDSYGNLSGEAVGQLDHLIKDIREAGNVANVSIESTQTAFGRSRSLTADNPVQRIARYLLDSSTPDTAERMREIIEPALRALSKTHKNLNSLDALHIHVFQDEIRKAVSAGFIQEAATADRARAAIEMIFFALSNSKGTSISLVSISIDSLACETFKEVRSLLREIEPGLDDIELQLNAADIFEALKILDRLLLDAIDTRQVSGGLLSKSAEVARENLRAKFDLGFRLLAKSLGRFVDSRGFGTIFLDHDVSSLMIVVRSGIRFSMGCKGGSASGGVISKAVQIAQPAHEVLIDQGYAIGCHTVSHDQFANFCSNTERRIPDGNGWQNGDLPVVNVNWFDAIDYCDWLSALTGLKYRLPSEAEWEFVCRAGSNDAFAPGNNLETSDANRFKREDIQSGPVAIDHPDIPANRFGVFHMHGNVWEWCLDDFVAGYVDHEGQRPRRIGSKGALKVIRGGSWNDPDSLLQSWYRHKADPGTRSSLLGFRVVRDVH